MKRGRNRGWCEGGGETPLGSLVKNAMGRSWSEDVKLVEVRGPNGPLEEAGDVDEGVKHLVCFACGKKAAKTVMRRVLRGRGWCPMPCPGAQQGRVSFRGGISEHVDNSRRARS